ncbi:hypothetical protein GCM10022242_17700 [Nocardioides panacisoli]|uniref:Uncharacterized protein n=1 Tax=Nocardioides panacisoli TaxID=627624 RepID=A0ABP7IE60_9ACTN
MRVSPVGVSPAGSPATDGVRLAGTYVSLFGRWDSPAAPVSQAVEGPGDNLGRGVEERPAPGDEAVHARFVD